jgi:hypothetical protein
MIKYVFSDLFLQQVLKSKYWFKIGFNQAIKHSSALRRAQSNGFFLKRET